MSLKIIGAGFPRTGTMTLKSALEQLGLQKTYHYKDLIANPEKIWFWKEIEEAGDTDWTSLFNGFQATVDFPGYPYYKIMMNRYPDAKVILTTRPFEDWYESTLCTIWARKVQADNSPKVNQSELANKKRRREDCVQFMRKVYLHKQFEGQLATKDKAAEKFYKHHAEVKAFVPKEKLLIYQVSEGWQPLCDFLGLSCPDMDFPHLNKKEDFHAMVNKMLDKPVAV